MAQCAITPLPCFLAALKVNRIINRPQSGDDEALPYLKQLIDEEPHEGALSPSQTLLCAFFPHATASSVGATREATHRQDSSAPYWTLLQKFAFYGCPKCCDFIVKAGADLNVVDQSGNRALDLARFGQSPAHRDMTVTLQKAMRAWRADEALRRIREAKEDAEAKCHRVQAPRFVVVEDL